MIKDFTYSKEGMLFLPPPSVKLGRVLPKIRRAIVN